jgi:hypothetical protein
MKKSYVNERSITAHIEIGLDDVTNLIDLLNEAYPEGENKTYRATALQKKLRQLRRDIAEEARREFEAMSNS